MQTKQRTALVTGSSSGIGRATAKALAGAGFTVYATARNVESMLDLSEGGIRTLRLDLTDEDSMSSAVATVESEAGGVDVLVNNAGYGEMGAIEDVSVERWQRQFATNVFGPVRLAQLVLPGMRAAGSGQIINVSSMGGEFTTPLAGAYHASKYALESVSDALRFEVAPFGVTVTVIQPGPVATPLAEKTREQLVASNGSAYGKAMAGLAEQAEGMSSGRGTLEPEQIAAVVVRAASTRKPRTRYKVGVMAHAMPGMRRWLGDRGFDAMMRRTLSLD